MGHIFGILLAFVAIIFGLLGIVKLVGNLELIAGLISLSFGILAIIWTLRARAALSKGSSLRRYTNNFLFCLIFILLFSIWHTTVKLFRLEGPAIYLEYIFITLAYLVFVIAAYQILYLGKEFGFQREVKVMKKVMKKD